MKFALRANERLRIRNEITSGARNEVRTACE